MTHYCNAIKTSISLTLEGVDETVQIDPKIVPTSLFPVYLGSFNKKRLDLQLRIRRRYHYASFSLGNNFTFTLLRSEITSYMDHCCP